MEDQKKRVYDALDKMKIKYETVEHEPVFTMAWTYEKGYFVQKSVLEGFKREEAFPGDGG